MTETVEGSVQRDLILEFQEILEEPVLNRRFQDAADEVHKALLTFDLGASPVGVDLGFTCCLDGVHFESLSKIRHIFRADRPSADQRLVKKILFVMVGNGPAFQHVHVKAVQTAPEVYFYFPPLRDFREDTDPRPDVLAALGVVSGGCIHGQRPATLP